MSRSSCSCIIRLLRLLPPWGCACLYNPLRRRRWQGSFMSPTPQAIARLAPLITARPSATSSAGGGSPRSRCYCASLGAGITEGRCFFFFFFQSLRRLQTSALLRASCSPVPSFLPSSLPCLPPTSPLSPSLRQAGRLAAGPDRSVDGALASAYEAKHCN